LIGICLAYYGGLNFLESDAKSLLTLQKVACIW